jgi:chemotaxis signal transduction protein
MTTDLHVWVRVGDEDYALAVDNVLEVAEIGEITPVPGTPGAVLGLRNLRGNVLTVVDLLAVLHLARPGKRQRIVVAEEGGRRAALAVDSVVGVQQLPGAREEVESPHLASAALVAGALVGVIDVKSILDSVQSRPTG